MHRFLRGLMMSRVDLSELIALLGDPSPEPFPVDWPSVETWLDCPLPAAYKEIGSTFGPWYVGDWLWVEVPCADQEGRPGFTTWLRDTTRLVRIRAREDGVDIPALYPQESGLLAWGHTRGTEVVFWDTAASPHPDDWPVVVYVNLGPLQDPWRHTGLTTIDFLARVLTGIPVNEYRALGPLPRSACRTLYRTDARAWTPPEPEIAAAADQERRRRALTEGSGHQALQALVQPPPKPPLDQSTWEALFDLLGTRLPVDYVHLMGAYGGGEWGGDLRFPPATHLSEFSEEAADAYRQLRDEFPEDFPLPVWPEPGGFLAFAHSVDGDYIGWLTAGDPDTWPVIVWPRHQEQGPPLETGVVDVLLAVLRGQPVAGFATLDPDDDPLEFATFTPSE